MTHCPDNKVGFAFTDSGGNFAGTALVSRVIAGVDCAERPNRCRIWALPYGNIDHIVSAGLSFDSTNPPVFPRATVVPTTNLRHQQIGHCCGNALLPEHLRGRSRNAWGRSTRRALSVSRQRRPTAGAFTTTVAVARRVGLSDCAVATVRDAGGRVSHRPSRRRSLVRSVGGTPAGPHGGGQPAHRPGRPASGRRRDPRRRCGQPGLHTPLPRRRIGVPRERLQDRERPGRRHSHGLAARSSRRAWTVRSCVASWTCSSTAGVVRVQGARRLRSGRAVGRQRSIHGPARGLWDRQRVEVRGERLDPGDALSVRQCISATASDAAGSAPQTMQVDSTRQPRRADSRFAAC